MTQEIFECVHMTCREDACSGFSQSAEFHILLWMGGLNRVTTFTHLLLPSREVERRSALCIGLGSGRGEGAALWLNQLFPSHFLLLPPSLPHNESVSPVRSES